MKLLKVVKLVNDVKKYQAIFLLDNGKEKKVKFGASGYTDYLISKDKERRERYRKRHQKDLKTNNPLRAGYLSYFLLWGNSTSLKQNIKDYKKKFKLWNY